MQNFYVYAYLRSKDSSTDKSGTPYYIGKGTGNRAYVKHYAPLPKDRSNITFIKQNLTEQQAHNLEIELIAKYGRKDLGTGILHNRTNSGEGISNPSLATREKLAYAKRNESLETKLKRSIAAKNRIRTPLSAETKQKISSANSGKKRSVETKEKMSNIAKGRSLSAKHKEHISKTLIGKPKAPFSNQHRENIGKVHRGKPWSAARRAAYENKGNQNS
jgi:hypothetical protein